MNWGEGQKDVHSQGGLLLIRTYLHNLVQLWGSSPAPVDERRTGCTKLAKGLTWLENSYLNQCYKRLQSIKSQTIPFFCSGVLPCLESIVCCLNSCLEICASWYEVHWVLRLITWVSSVDMSGTEQRTWSISKFPPISEFLLIIVLDPPLQWLDWWPQRSVLI